MRILSRPGIATVVVGGGAGLVLGLMVVTRQDLAALVTVATLGVMALVLLVRLLIRWPEAPDAQQRLLTWAVGSFLAHLAFGLVVTSSTALSGYLGGDAGTYHSLASAIMQHWTEGTIMPRLPAGKEGFYFLLAGLYYVFGSYAWAGVALNATMAAALVPLMSDATRRLVGRRAAGYVPPLVVLLPGLFLFTGQLLKEASVLFLIAVAVASGARALERASAGRLVLLVGALTLLFAFRGPIALALAATLVAGIVLGKQQFAGGVTVGLVMVSLMAVFLSVGIGTSGYQSATSTDLAKASLQRQASASLASSSFYAEADVSTPRRALSFLPVGLVNVALGPFPWQIRSLRQAPAVPDAISWWILVPSLLRGIRGARALMGRRVLALALPAFAILAVVALTIGNFGTVVRERQQLLILVIPFIALGLALRREGLTELKQAELSSGR